MTVRFAQQKSFPLARLPQGASTQANSGEGPSSGERQAENAIVNLYVQFAGIFAAYDLPGGALTRVFTANNLVPVPDGQGGTYLVGTIQLDIQRRPEFMRPLSAAITTWWIYCVSCLMALLLSTASASSAVQRLLQPTVMTLKTEQSVLGAMKLGL